MLRWADVSKAGEAKPRVQIKGVQRGARLVGDDQLWEPLNASRVARSPAFDDALDHCEAQQSAIVRTGTCPKKNPREAGLAGGGPCGGREEPRSA